MWKVEDQSEKSRFHRNLFRGNKKWLQKVANKIKGHEKHGEGTCDQSLNNFRRRTLIYCIYFMTVTRFSNAKLTMERRGRGGEVRQGSHALGTALTDHLMDHLFAKAGPEGILKLIIPRTNTAGAFYCTSMWVALLYDLMSQWQNNWSLRALSQIGVVGGHCCRILWT